MSEIYDILIIGGGINGCGIARDAAGRGYNVCLCEADDLASGTSSQSTKLIHGGLRYLEYYEFRLVREALSEREILWQMAPHIIHPMRFILPYHKGLRPAWLLRLGLFLYDHIGGRKLLPPTKTLDLAKDNSGKPLRQNYKKGFEYSDCAVDDARLVVLNAMDAANRGAHIMTRAKCTRVSRTDNTWVATIKDQVTGDNTEIRAKMIINATGPWVDKVLKTIHPNEDQQHIRLVQGSHIIVPRLYDHDKSYIFQNKDNRIIFAIPYQEKFTLIGTTDHEYWGDPRKSKITPEEIEYLCRAANEYFTHQITPDDIVSTFSGVRSLYNDGASKAQEATRDYVLEVDRPSPKVAPLINIFGGKITTYRRLAESVLEKVEGLCEKEDEQNQGKWTQSAPLPGGNFKLSQYASHLDTLKDDYPFLLPDHAEHLFKRYGTQVYQVLGEAQDYSDLGIHFGHQLYEAEVNYLIKHEWALTADDILWRRTKLGLLFSQEEQEHLTQWLKEHA